MKHDTAHHYRSLLVMTLMSFAAMYFLMYSMVNSFGNVFMNVNNLYMAALMAAPMVVFELIVMQSMYADARLNAVFGAAAIFLGVLFFMLIRQQGAVGDRQFLRSMIPHHASAILMCNQAAIQDPEIKDLCGQIVSSQQREVDQMKARLHELGD